MTEAEALGISEATYGGGTGQTSAPDTSASGGSDPSPFDPFSADAETFFGGVASGSSGLGGYREESGSSSPSFDTLYDAAIYDAIAGLTAPPAPAGMSPAVADVLRDYQDRFGGSGDLAGLGVTFNTPINTDGTPVDTGGTRSLASVVAGTPSTPSYTATEGDYGQNIFSILDQGITGMQTGTSGRGQLDALSAAGLGNMPGMNPNNPTQTVDQLINSYRAGNFLDKYAPTIFGAATGFGPQMSAIRMGADVLSGKATPGQALTGLGLDFLAGKAGLPGGGRVLGDVLDGRMDRAASGLTQAGLAAALGRAANIRAPFAGIALQETGLGPKAGAAVGNAVGPSQPTGVTSSITQLFDKGLGGLKEIFSGLPQGGAGTAGTAPTAQTGGVPYYGYAGDSSPDSPATVAAPAAPAAPTTPEVQAAQRLLYGIAQGPYGPLLAYDIGGRG